ncbi:MAG: hypothetical protein M3R57_09540, partial [Chloroflexota bacterium]|nr:hypothetical protein [Chloroflexota bacterium]
MQKRLFGLLAVAVMVFTACGTTSTSSSPSIAASTPPSTVAPSSSANAGGEIDLTTTNYKPEAVGNRGGKLLFSTSGEPNSIWYGAYDNFAGDTEAFGPSLWGLWNNTADFKYYGQLATNVPLVSNGGVTVNGDKMDVKIELIPG